MPEIKRKEKGTRGEREIVLTIGIIVRRVFEARGLRVPEIVRSDRGCDIEGLVDYAFEVKRDEVTRDKNDGLAWAQVETYAREAGRIPVLFYRANNRKWRVKIETMLSVPGSSSFGPITIVDIGIEPFLDWFMADLDARIEEKLQKMKGIFS